MSRIRAKDTGPEMDLRRRLRAAGLSHYRLHPGNVPGRPDVAFIGVRVAIFVHGCFWHSCPHCSPARPRSHRMFWVRKLERNRARDRRKARELRRSGWAVVTVWECRLRKYPGLQVARIQRTLAARY
ncbi:MAG: very short patch repair endonuclease [Flavobacteriales bacterium]|nr:very short patch repair endonuclease [Flavobacteriales bacterium]